MSNENKESVWNNGSLDEMEYIGFSKDETTISVKFLEDEPNLSVNKFNTVTYDFQVMDMSTKTVKVFGVTSKRLMRHLKAQLPISGKTFKIERVGDGMKTDYELKEVK